MDEIGPLSIPQAIKEKMNKAARIHMETSLEERIKFIIEDFPCISRDRNIPADAMEDIERVGAKDKFETWDDVIIRTNEGAEELKDLADIHCILKALSDDGVENMKGNIFFIGKPIDDNEENTPKSMQALF